MVSRGDGRVTYRVLVWSSDGKNHLEGLGLDKKNWDGKTWTGFILLRIGTGGLHL